MRKRRRGTLPKYLRTVWEWADRIRERKHIPDKYQLCLTKELLTQPNRETTAFCFCFGFCGLLRVWRRTWAFFFKSRRWATAGAHRPSVSQIQNSRISPRALSYQDPRLLTHCTPFHGYALRSTVSTVSRASWGHVSHMDINPPPHKGKVTLLHLCAMLSQEGTGMLWCRHFLERYLDDLRDKHTRTFKIGAIHENLRTCHQNRDIGSNEINNETLVK